MTRPVLVLLALASLGCTRGACIAPETCQHYCADPATNLSSPLADLCQCVVSCDLGTCRGAAYCPP